MLKRLDLTFTGILFTIAQLGLVIQMGTAVVAYGQHALAAVQFPYPLDYGEGPVLDQVLRLSRFENIYREDVTTPPYTISNYPPFFHLLQVPFAWLFGPAFWYGRVLSLVSAILAALMIGLAIHTLTGDRIAAAIAGLTLFTFPYILRWSAFDRVDTLALALSWSGLFAVVRWPDRRRGLVLAVILFTAAIYTRQSYGLVGPGTALAWLLQGRRWRQALRLTGWLAGVCSVLFLGLNWATGGGFFFNIITANVNALSHTNAMAYGTELSIHSWILILGAAGFLIVERWWYPTRSWPLVLPYVLLSAATIPLAGKEGSSINYFYEPIAALCLATGAVLSWPRRNYLLKAAVTVLLIIQINTLARWSRDEYIPLTTSRVNAVLEIAQMERIVREATGPVLSDEYLGLMPLTGRPIYFQPFEFGQLHKANLWEPSPLIAAIERREFPAILLYEPPTGSPLIVTRWTLPIRNAIWANYELQTTLADTWIYTPLR
jgi:4-amino-4-deoxy-L-arabinose transferase-like glycosyltransferase